MEQINQQSSKPGYNRSLFPEWTNQPPINHLSAIELPRIPETDHPLVSVELQENYIVSPIIEDFRKYYLLYEMIRDASMDRV